MNRTAAVFRARRLAAGLRLLDCADCAEVAAIGEDIPIHGLAAPWGQTGDGRAIQKDSLTWNLDEPIPIIFDRRDGDHSGAIVGRIDRLWPDQTGVWMEGRLLATADPEASADVARVAELIGQHAIGWSVMLDDEEQEVVHREPVVTESADGTITARFRRDDDLMTIVAGRIRHLALVDTAAFGQAFPIMGLAPVNASTVTVATYPAAHFEKFINDDASRGVPLQVDPDGRVWGQIAGQGCYRDGSGQTCKKYTPDPDREMRNFHTSTIHTDTGASIRVGLITAGGLHAPLTADINGQRAHRENSTTAWAVVRAWDDAFGRLCVAGSIIPGLDPGFVNQAAACPVSIERWPVPGVPGLTLAGALSVPSPAWPVL
jgi:hypothetical protein